MNGGAENMTRRTALESFWCGIASAIAWPALVSEAGTAAQQVAAPERLGAIDRASAIGREGPPPSSPSFPGSGESAAHAPATAPDTGSAPSGPGSQAPSTEGRAETPQASEAAGRHAFDAAVAALRGLQSGMLCGACDGRGVVSRRTRVGSRDIGGGMRVPVYASKEGQCTACDGEGCAIRRRCERLVTVALQRLALVPDAHGLRTEAVLAARRTLEALLVSAAPALVRRSAELAADAIVRARESPTAMLLIAESAPRGDASSGTRAKGAPRGADSSGKLDAGDSGGPSGERGAGRAGGSGEMLVDGVLWRLVEDVAGGQRTIATGSIDGWVAALGWIDVQPTGSTVRRGNIELPVVELRAFAVASRARPPRRASDRDTASAATTLGR